jgi:ethanolamine utilization protein EutJ
MRTDVDSDVEAYLIEAALTYGSPASGSVPPFRCGIDLGTDTVVIAIVDADGRPVFHESRKCEAVRDGVVVDFAGAGAATRTLVAAATAALGVPIGSATAAFPPGVSEADARACRYVLESAGLECVGLVDEVTAAQALLQVRDGVVVDVGGGSTGVGSFRDSELVRLGDLPGGGHHLDLILAGALHLPLAEAEVEKRRDPDNHLAILKPGVEKIAANVAKLMDPSVDGPVYLTGGALMIKGAERVVAAYLDREVVRPSNALLVTPFGIALSTPTT